MREATGAPVMMHRRTCKCIKHLEMQAAWQLRDAELAEVDDFLSEVTPSLGRL